MSKVLKNSTLFLMSLLPLAIIFVPSSLFFPFITGKAFFFRILVEIMLGLYLGLCLVDYSYRPKKSLLFISLCVFGGVMLMADIFSPNPVKAFWSNFERMEGFVTLAHLLIYFLIASAVLKEKKDWNRIFFVFTAVSFYLIFFGILQWTGDLSINQGSTRLDGSLGNAAYFAIYLVFQIAFFVLLWWRNRGELKGIGKSFCAGSLGFLAYYLYYVSSPFVEAMSFGKIFASIIFVFSILILGILYFGKNEKIKKGLSHALYSLGVVLNVVLLYLTATRGAILGFLGGFFIFALYLLFFNKENKKLKKIGGIIVLAIISLIILFLALKDLPVIKNNPILGRFSSISWSETKDQARSYTWPMAIEGFKERPILGWGQEGFVYVFNEHYNPLMWNHEPWFDRAHNTFLDYLVAGGILGFLSYIFIFISAIYLIFKNKNNDVFEKALILGLFGAYAFNNIFVFDNLISYILFFTVLGMVHSEFTWREENNLSYKESKEVLTPVIFFIFLSLITAYFLNAGAIRQNRTLVEGINILNTPEENILSCVKSSYQKDADGSYKNVCTDAQPTLELFKKVFSLNNFGLAEAREQLIKISNDLNIRKDVSNATKDEFARLVLDEYQKQLIETPLEAREFLMLGSYLDSIGLNEEATQILENALSLSPKKQQIMLALASTYLNKKDDQKAYDFVQTAYNEDQSYVEVKIIYSLLTFRLGKVVEGQKLVDELADSGIADQRIVQGLTVGFGKEKARAYLNRVLKAVPTNILAIKMLENLGK